VLVNMLSMSIFPFLAQPMIQVIHGMGNQDFEQFVAARRTEVAQFIIHAIQAEGVPAKRPTSVLNDVATA
jgi:TetR/AcrR family transcriptional regulator